MCKRVLNIYRYMVMNHHLDQMTWYIVAFTLYKQRNTLCNKLLTCKSQDAKLLAFRGIQKHCQKAIFLTESHFSDKDFRTETLKKSRSWKAKCFRKVEKTCGKPIFRGGFPKRNPIIYRNFAPRNLYLTL